MGEECSKGLKMCVSFIYLNFEAFLENGFSLLMTQNPYCLQSSYFVQNNTNQNILFDLKCKYDESQVIVTNIFHASGSNLSILWQWWLKAIVDPNLFLNLLA